MSKRVAIPILICCAFLTFLNLAPFAWSNHTLFDPLIDVTDLVHKYYVTEVEEEELVSGAINGMLHELDPYSEYIPPGELEEFNEQTSGRYEGIGIGIDIANGFLIVISPFEHSPAYQAGVRAGDIILEVNGKSTKGWSATRAVKEIKGPAGTQVKIKVLHEEGTEEVLKITRRQIHVPTLRGWRRIGENDTWDYILDEDLDIGYIRITQFSGETAPDFIRLVEQLRKDGMQALIMDLRLNPGGLMTAATEIVDSFINQGTIVSTRGVHTREEVIKATSNHTFPRFHLVVLIDQGSASASEIVAGALQDHDRAVIVGTRSWGKGSVQRLFRLPDSGAALKLTTDYYYLPNGRCVHRKEGAESWGVMPDVEEKLNPDNLITLRNLLQELSGIHRSDEDVPDETAPEDTTQQQPPADTADIALSRQDYLERLLTLDNQLAQAVKQCKGLMRTQPDLKTLTESVIENSAKTADK